QVLLDLQHAWGKIFSGWMAGRDCRLAYNMDCDDQGMVTYIDLGHQPLTGSIPGYISALERLTYLDLSGNNLKGSIPSTFGTMSSLEF
ncbi:unnamed protein product, partial [Closterium sp. Naga37s-1]